MKKRIKIISALCTLVLACAFLSSCVYLGNSSDTGFSSIPDKAEVTTYPQDKNDTTANVTTESTTEEITEVTTSKNEGLTQAPDLTFYDFNGNKVKLSDFFGKPIVLNFWASWCPPCVGEMPEFAEVYREMKDDVVFLFINCTDGATETVRTVQNFIVKNGYNDLPIYLDKTDARKAYGVSAIPFTFFINEDGYIVNSINSSISKDRLLSEIAKIYTP